MNDNHDKLLIPEESIEYFFDAINIDQKKYLRAASIRFCLENIVETVFLHISGKNEVGKIKIKWKKATLGERIGMLQDYFPEEIIDKIRKIKKLGDKGSHPKSHDLITQNEIDYVLKDLSHVCEWSLLAYFLKYGFDIHPWLPTILSTLPPENRIRILEKLFDNTVALVMNKEGLEKYQTALAIKQDAILNGDFDVLLNVKELFGETAEIKEFGQLHLLVDKLAMAYLKNNMYEKSLKFILDCFEQNLISDNYKNCMVYKIDDMKPELQQFNISRSISDARYKYKELLKIVDKKDESLFVTIFTAVLAVNELPQSSA